MRTHRSLVLSLPLLALGCGGGESFPSQTAANACVPDAAGAPWTLDDATTDGSYAVGTLTPTFVDTARTTPAYGTYAGDTVRTLVTGIWYPSTTGGAGAVAATGGPFPVVMYSHGFSSTQNENIQLYELLASHGYMVVSIKFPLSNIFAPDGPTAIDLLSQPGDVTYVLDQVLAYGTTAGHPLEGAVDGSRVAAAGLSLGGMTTLLTTFHGNLRDPRIDVAVAMAPPGSMFLPSYYDTSDAPLLVLHGDADAIVPYDPNATTIQQNARSPMGLLTLARGTHTGFSSASLLFEGMPGFENIDSLGCGQIAPGGGGGSPAMMDYEAILGGAALGIGNPTSYGVFCPANLGTGMLPSRQQLLEKAAVLSFLDSYLAPDATTRGQACHFTERVLPREADVSIFMR